MYISLTTSPRPDRRRSRERGPRRGIRTVSSTVVSLGVVSLLTDISSESVVAILPLYITGALGLSVVAFGFIDGLYQGVSALARIAGGNVSDRLDQPKWVAFTGYSLAAVARVFLLFISGFAAVAAVVTADRIGKGIRTAPRDALITAASPPDGLGVAFGVHRTLDNIGAALGPLLAFFVLLMIPDGFHTVFVASLACAVIAVAILGLVVPNLRIRGPRSPVTERSGHTRFDWTAVTKGPLRRVLSGAAVLGLVTIGDGFVYLTLQSRSDFAAQWFPLMYVGTNVAFLALAIPLGRLADRTGRARVFVWGHLALLAAYLVAALPMPDLAATILCLVLLGAFYAATDGVLAALAAQYTPPPARATGIAAAQTVTALSRFVATATFGMLWYAVGATPALLIVALLLAVAVPLVAVLLQPLIREASALGGPPAPARESFGEDE